MARIGLGTLLLSALEGTSRAGAAIVSHRVKNNGKFGVHEKEDNKGPQTQADLMSQVVLLDSIASKIPQTSIVAEEGDIDPEVWKKLLNEDIAPVSSTDLPTEQKLQEIIPKQYDSLPIDNISIFIDPLDGTKEYISGSTTVPMAMLGICLNHTPIAGILYQPFLEKFTIGIVGKGCFQYKEGNLVPFADLVAMKDQIVTTSNSHFTETIKTQLEQLEASKIIREGGAGYKVLSLLEQRASIYCYPSKGTSLWDSCGPEACIIAAGGMLTDCNVRIVNAVFSL